MTIRFGIGFHSIELAMGINQSENEETVRHQSQHKTKSLFQKGGVRNLNRGWVFEFQGVKLNQAVGLFCSCQLQSPTVRLVSICYRGARYFLIPYVFSTNQHSPFVTKRQNQKWKNPIGLRELQSFNFN